MRTTARMHVACAQLNQPPARDPTLPGAARRPGRTAQQPNRAKPAAHDPAADKQTSRLLAARPEAKSQEVRKLKPRAEQRCQTGSGPLQAAGHDTNQLILLAGDQRWSSAAKGRRGFCVSKKRDDRKVGWSDLLDASKC